MKFARIFTMKVDVIIPTYRPGDKFRRLLEMLGRQNVSVSQLIIINTEEALFRAELLDGIERVRIVHISKKEFDHGGTRDRAARISDADIMVFMTQDAIPADERLLEELLKPFADPEVGASYARQMPNEDCSEIERFTRAFNYPGEDRVKSMDDIGSLGIKTFFCSNVCAAYRRCTYLESGGFVQETIFNEDMIYAGKLIKNGGKIAYASKACVIHSHNYSCVEQFHRNFDLAVSQRQHPEVFCGIRSESEGMKLVKQTAVYLVRIRKPWLIIPLVCQSGFKWLGYKFGSHYEQLPRWLVMSCTMNKGYWEKSEEA